MANLTAETNDPFASLLELAANNDVEGLKQIADNNFSGINEVALWYTRETGSKQMVLLHRTPLMVASTYGSIDVVKHIVSIPVTDINKACGVDNSTALHCAASSGLLNAIAIVKVLLDAGANPNLVNAKGYRPVDVIVFPSKLEKLGKKSLEELLLTDFTSRNSDLSGENGFLSPGQLKIGNTNQVLVKKEYPLDPYLPDINNGIYSTDEFRMFSFKIRPCSRAYSHDWTECPFVHPGENARRRDPRKYHYSCVPCPDFRKGVCQKGDMCDYAHGLFESWLHPAQYRTRICKDGTGCHRRVCFFAHAQDELRSMYSSPRSSSANPIDFASAMSLFPNSPSSLFTLPLSPSANAGWAQQNAPTLHLPGTNLLNGSRLRSSFNARDFQADRLLRASNLEEFLLAQADSPRHVEDVFSPLNMFYKKKSMLSPINTSTPPKSSDHYFPQSPIVGPSSGPVSPMSSRVPMPGENFRSLSSRDLGTHVPSWINRGTAGGNADRVVNGNEYGKLNDDVQELNIGWVHSLVKESPPEKCEDNRVAEGGGSSGEGSGLASESNRQVLEELDTVLGEWLEHMKMDEPVA